MKDRFHEAIEKKTIRENKQKSSKQREPQT